MSGRTTVCDLRDEIEEIYRKVRDENDGNAIENAVVLDRVRNELSGILARAAPDLIQMQLVRLLNDVARRNRTDQALFFDTDLFGAYPKLKNSVSIRRGVKKDTANLTVFEAEAELARRAQKNALKPSDDLQRLTDDCRPFRKSDDDTLRTLLERKRAAEG